MISNPPEATINTITASSIIPVFELTAIRQHVQECAKAQWSTLKPERMVCVGMTEFPGAIQNVNEKATAVIEWFNDMRSIFELKLPDTFIITFNDRHMILISSSKTTFAE